MARPKSEDKREAIMAAAIRVIAAQGLGAPTSLIAREAGISNGSLFTYFDTKATLFNALYCELKSAMAAAALDGMPTGAAPREQMQHFWMSSMRWALPNMDGRRALAQLGVSDEITADSRAAGHQAMTGIRELLMRIHANGPMRDVPMALLTALMNSMADATMDFIVNDRDNAERHGQAGFEALWRAVA